MPDELIPEPLDHLQTPFHDALEKLGNSGEGLELSGARDQQGHAGVAIEATKTLGKGWSLSAAGQWVKDAGYAVLGKLKWTPKP